MEKNEELLSIADAVSHVANSITTPGAPYHGRDGGVVASLTEAVIYMASALHRIADALENSEPFNVKIMKDDE